MLLQIDGNSIVLTQETAEEGNLLQTLFLVGVRLDRFGINDGRRQLVLMPAGVKPKDGDDRLKFLLDENPPILENQVNAPQESP